MDEEGTRRSLTEGKPVFDQRDASSHRKRMGTRVGRTEDASMASPTLSIGPLYSDLSYNASLQMFDARVLGIVRKCLESGG